MIVEVVIVGLANKCIWAGAGFWVTVWGYVQMRIILAPPYFMGYLI